MERNLSLTNQSVALQIIQKNRNAVDTGTGILSNTQGSTKQSPLSLYLTSVNTM
jgi:hypothetical protein